jgi:CRP/FNR family transcriptional regulator, cyclic AMP receptor protein
MDQQQRVAALKRVPILAALARADLEHVVKACKWQDYDAGEEILSYRDPSTDVFFLAAGKVRVIIYSAEGKAVLFTDLKAGATFGEIAAIDREPRSAGAEAIGSCTVAFLTASQFEVLLLKHPAMAYATLRHLGAEVRRLSERVLEFSTLMVQNRIQAELLRLAADAGQRDGQALLSPAPSLSEVADRVSTHREAVSRELSRLGSVGLLRRERGDLRITDIARLARLVREAKGQ